jgi:hypothetical protein
MLGESSIFGDYPLMNYRPDGPIKNMPIKKKKRPGNPIQIKWYPA